MLDICFCDAVYGNLMMAQKLLNTDGVIRLNLHLNYGKLSGNVIAAQAKRNTDSLLSLSPSIEAKELEDYHTQELQQFRQHLKDLESTLKDGQPIRIWVSHTAQDRCNLLWLCHFFKKCHPKIFVVVCPGYESDPSGNGYLENGNWGSFINHRFMAECVNNAIELAESEIEESAQIWRQLVRKNAPLRVLIDGNLISTSEDFFDAMILQHIHSKPTSQAIILGDFFAEHIGADVAFVCSRIDYLLERNIIKVCKDKTDAQGCNWQRTLSKA